KGNKSNRTNVAPDPNSRSYSLATVWAGELGVRRLVLSKCEQNENMLSLEN
ncbi:MAG: hypothetical protein FD167_6026, partial [bacterium]